MARTKRTCERSAAFAPGYGVKSSVIDVGKLTSVRQITPLFNDSSENFCYSTLYQCNAGQNLLTMDVVDAIISYHKIVYQFVHSLTNCYQVL